MSGFFCLSHGKRETFQKQTDFFHDQLVLSLSVIHINYLYISFNLSRDWFWVGSEVIVFLFDIRSFLAGGGMIAICL